MSAPRLGARLFLRELRTGELSALALAIIVAVAAITAVNAFADRLRLALGNEAASLLAADLVAEDGSALPADWGQEAARRGLATAETRVFPSVLVGADGVQLIEVKAVSAAYPLRGQVRVQDERDAPERIAAQGPTRGELWLDPLLGESMRLRIGDVVPLGAIRFRVGAWLTQEPDRGSELFAVAPRVIMNLDDLDATRLVTTGSRVRFRLLMAGAPATVQAMRDWLDARATGYQRLHDARDARPELRSALERGEQFLGLAALVSVLIAGVAIAIAARRYSARHFDAAAVLRCLGATRRTLWIVHGTVLMVLGLVAGAVGAALGYLAQAGIAALLVGLVATTLPPPGVWPAVSGILTGLVLLFAFAFGALLRLGQVPTLRVLRRELGPLPVSGWLVYGVATAAFALLVLWQAMDARLAAWVMIGTAATFALITLAGWLLVRGLGRLGARRGIAVRFGFTNLVRRGGGSVAQIAAFGIGLMALLLLAVVRNDLLDAWHRKLPAEAANHFVTNVASDQVAAMQVFFAKHAVDAAPLMPMVRGQITAINGQPAEQVKFGNQRAYRLLAHQFNISWARDLPGENRLAAGRWWTAGARDTQASIEKGMAESLGLKVGDRLGFRILDRELAVTVTSLRALEWESFRPNFFVLLPPGVLSAQDAIWVTSFYLPPERRALVGELVRAFPNVTVIDVSAVMTRVRAVVDRVTGAVEVVFLFTLLAGLTVLAAAIQATRDERLRESALLRVLGASRRVVLTGLVTEFAMLGLAAGLLAALAANAIGIVIAREFFRLDYGPSPLLWLTGLLAGAVGVGVAGVLGTRFVVNRPPLAVLREE
jgi:putative ABC transport system permease protein